MEQKEVQKFEKKILDKEVFEYLKEKAPEFLQSYYMLSKFYEHMTNSYTHKVWKDGRLVLTPVINNQEVKDNEES